MRRPFFRFSITAKLCLLNGLICIVFGILLSIMLSAFGELRSLVGQDIEQFLNKIQQNTVVSRQIAELDSYTGLLISRFYRNAPLLQKDKTRIRDKAEQLMVYAEDAAFVDILRRYENALDAFLVQCENINTRLSQLTATDRRIQDLLHELEGDLSDRLISTLMEGEDAHFYEQLRALMPLFHEQVLQVALMVSRLSPLTSDTRVTERILLQLDEMRERFGMLTDADPGITAFGEVLLAEVDGYQELLVGMNDAFIEFRVKRLVLEQTTQEIQGIVTRLDRELVHAGGMMRFRSQGIMASAIKVAVSVLIAMILVFGVLTALFFMWTIRRPMKVIRSGLEEIRNGNLDAKIRLQRRDEWLIIEEALNSMVRQLKQSLKYLESENRHRRETEAALQEERDLLKLVMETSPLGILVANESGRFIFANSRAEEVFGTPRAEILQLAYDSPVWHHADAGGEPLEPDGLPFRIVADSDEPLRDFRLSVWRNPEERRILSVYAAPMYTARGAFSGVVEMFEDITENVAAEAERENLQMQLRQAHKMEAVGTLAGGIAHDFNNILMGIQGRTSLILLTVNPEDPNYRHLKSIEGHVQDAANLTKQILGFARGGKYEVRPLNLNDVVRSRLQMFGRTRKDIVIHADFDSDLWIVDADMDQMDQMLLNLFVNAAQAMAEGGDLYVRTENIQLDRNYVKPFQVKRGPYAKISITDTGVGMDEETRWRVFEPFFTTKEKGIDKGAGLGLASVYGIVKNHGGFINVYSEKGEGSTFTIYLPASAGKPGVSETDPSRIFRGSGMVLLVDDEEMIMDVGREMIRHLGYEVITASSGEEALSLYRENRERVDVVILDMIMPGMDGGATFDQLRQMDAKVRVILSSGYSLNGKASEIMKRGCRGFIQKPFNIESLSRKLRDVLAGDRAAPDNAGDNTPPE